MWAWATAASSSWTGWSWLRERAYDPATRAFLSPDPLPAVPGTAYAANPYHYAGNDPVNNVDPLGLRPVTDAELAGEHDSGGGLLSSIGHGLLDVAGLVPVVGEAADLANAAWYTAEGDYTMAALSAAAAIPFAGWAATGAKGVIKGGAAVEKLTAKAVVEGAQGAKRASGLHRERGRYRHPDQPGSTRRRIPGCRLPQLADPEVTGDGVHVAQRYPRPRDGAVGSGTPSRVVHERERRSGRRLHRQARAAAARTRQARAVGLHPPANARGARPMTDDVAEAIRTDLPRQVRGLEVNDPVLTLYGDDWSLTLMCPWKVEGPGGGFGWESESIEDDAWELVGQSLLSVSPTDVDPVFELSGGFSITVSADTDLDPWTLRLPHVLVVGRHGTAQNDS